MVGQPIRAALHVVKRRSANACGCRAVLLGRPTKGCPQLVRYFLAPPLRAASMLTIPDPRVAM